MLRVYFRVFVFYPVPNSVFLLLYVLMQRHSGRLLVLCHSFLLLMPLALLWCCNHLWRVTKLNLANVTWQFCYKTSLNVYTFSINAPTFFLKMLTLMKKMTPLLKILLWSSVFLLLVLYYLPPFSLPSLFKWRGYKENSDAACLKRKRSQGTVIVDFYFFFL